MTRNEGTVDRAIRGVAGVAALVYGGMSLDSTVGIVAAVVGVVLVGTAAVGFCPLYRLVGVNTCPTR